MLEEYIRSHLEEIDEERKNLNLRFEELNRQEEETKNKISILLDSEDVGVELFSPRKAHVDVKQQVTALRSALEDLQLAIAHVSDLIAENQSRREKYLHMLDDAQQVEEEKRLTKQAAKQEAEHIAECAAAQTPETNASLKPHTEDDLYRENLLEILRRVEKAMNFSHNDRNKCKNELKSLQYFVKALLAEK